MIQLPSKLDVERAVEIWGAQDARLQQLLDRYGAVAPALRHYGLVLWESGQAQNAAQALVGAVALTPGDVRCWNDLAGAFEAAGQRKEAAACLTEFVARDDAQAAVWMRLAAIRAASGDVAAAETDYRRSLAIDDSSGDAWFGLGLILYEAKRYAEARVPLEQAIARGRGADARAQACLGQARDALGDFEGAAAALSEACRLDPASAELRKRRARPLFVLEVAQRSVDEAVATLASNGLDATERERIVADSFHLLSAFGFQEAAIRLGEWRMARSPGDAMQAYLLAILKGEEMARAPDDYIVSYFDRFAEDFDEKLVGLLGYRAPGELARLVGATGRTIDSVLDLGCGTGLAGPLLQAPGRRQTGVDLSPRMLEKARLRGCYERLVEAEALAFVQHEAAHYDLVLTADVLVYFGDLEALATGIAARLRPGGLWALTIETNETRDVQPLPSGRFAHRPNYLRRIATAAGLTIIELVPTTIRLEANRPAVGLLALLERPVA